MDRRNIYILALIILSAIPSLAYDNVTATGIDCESLVTCGECVTHLECGFCVKDNKCVQAGWKGPLGQHSSCTEDKWEYQFGQCFVTHKQALIAFSSAMAGIILFVLTLCMCCCLCRCCLPRRRHDEERTPLLLAETLPTHHFRRGSFYNYNRNRPFERRGRTLSSGSTANSSSLGLSRTWRTGDEYLYSYQTPGYSWFGGDSPPVDYPSTGNGAGEWRRWEKKREELLKTYGKSNEG